MKKTPEFMIRVKLPSSSSFAACPSGDTDYEIAYKKAVDEVLPRGFEVVKLRLNERWPMDSEGYTWMRITTNNRDDALIAQMMDAAEYYEKLQKIYKYLDELQKMAK